MSLTQPTPIVAPEPAPTGPPVSAREAANEREPMPLPRDPKTIFLGGLFALACLFALSLGRSFLLPIVLAIVLKLLLQPLVKTLRRFHVPRTLGALFAIMLLMAGIGGILFLLTGPAIAWIGALPKSVPRIQETFAFLRGPLASLEALLRRIGLTSSDGGGAPLPVNPADLLTTVFSGSGAAASMLLETMLVLFYLLVFGETFLRRIVEILPRFEDKRQAVSISLQIERDISGYLLTISAINAVIGVATGLIMWSCGIPNPVLWGVVAFCLNYIQILGPFTGILVFTAVGITTSGMTWIALLPAALYFAVHVIEGEIVTPMLLARRFTINPVAVIVALLFWYWMWGVLGAILSVPLLAIVKITCDGLTPLRAIGHLLGGDGPKERGTAG